VRDDADHHLDGHEADDQRERDYERPNGRLRTDAVVVVTVTVVVMGHGRSLTEGMSDGIVFVEIPAGSRNKYEWDDELGGLALDRRLFTSMSYPADYGFVEGTLAEDGDPLDALVLVGEPTFPGCRIRVRAVGVFHMTDEKGPDEKVLCVPLNDPSWSGIADIHDVPAQLRNEIEHFFQVYKDLEEKKTETRGFGNRSDAQAIIAASRERLSVAEA
jgi:inorganic pyrophosphatase